MRLVRAESAACFNLPRPELIPVTTRLRVFRVAFMIIEIITRLIQFTTARMMNGLREFVRDDGPSESC
jgi:hypothetical protein